MKTFSILTLGCKVNQYESQQMRELLASYGLSHSDTADRADLFIVHTCCVTHNASAKSRQLIRKLRKTSPESSIIVSGCLATADLGELNISDDKISIVKDRERLASVLSDFAVFGRERHNVSETSQEHGIRTNGEGKIKHKKAFETASELPGLTSYDGQTRAFLKVQDGCDSYCTYCIIPKTRPVLSSKPVEDVLGEAESLVDAGHKEIVVTGIFLGAYGLGTARRRRWENETNGHLTELLASLAGIKGLERIRLSSLEPRDVTQELLMVMADNPNILPHLHLSLQSGSDDVLKRMCRQYRRDEFLEVCGMAKEVLDRPAISTDVIVGFPGEKDGDFEQTVGLAKEVGFMKMHVFPFSMRKGTAAEKLKGRVDPAAVKERCRILRKLDKELAFNFRQQFLGEKSVVLVEKTGDIVCGTAERYFEVEIQNGESLSKNDLIEVRIDSNYEGRVSGQPV